MATGLKFWIKEEEGLYYLCIENNGAVHLCGYHTADLRRWFCTSEIQVSRLIYSIVYTFICIDIQIGWQVSVQQDGRLADTHVYVYICLIASMLTYLSYRAYHIYSIVYTMICMVIKKCWHVSGQQVSHRYVNRYTSTYINGYLPSCRPADRAYHV